MTHAKDKGADHDRPACSVVVPAYNAAATIGAAIQSALSQTLGDLEVIVVDDGSADATAAVAERIDDLRVKVISQSNRGLPAARNAGIRASRGSYVAFLDSDDLWLPRYLELTTRALHADRDAGFAYTDAYAFDPVTGRVRRRTAMERMRPPIPPPRDMTAFLFELLKRNFVFVSTTVPRTVLDVVGGFDEKRTSVEDYELWLKIIIAGYRAAWVPGQHALYRVHPGQMSVNSARMYRNLADVFAAVGMHDMPTAAHRELLAARRLELAGSVEMVTGEAPLRSGLDWMRQVLGRIPKQLGIRDTWYSKPPPEVAAAFEDLSTV